MNPAVLNVACPRSNARGFTLIELMITLVVLAVVVIALAGVILTTSRSKTSSVNSIESSQSARIATDMIARDLRSAGYGADLTAATPQRPIAYIDSLELIVNENIKPYPDSSAVHGWPLAYNPATAPNPKPLNGTTWQPAQKYLTGAECVRWTMDLNNDGVVDQNDIADANGVDAMRTPNPNDYILARQVYGDSTNALIGNNGGSIERISLIARPGGTVPPLYTVYLNGSATPWDWSNGPIPASQLASITRVRINATSESARPDWRNRYARTSFKTDVSSLRNVPDTGPSTYDLDGTIFNDLNKNLVRDAGEPGLSSVLLRAGIYTATTDASGYFYFKVPGATYTLRQYPPAGFGVFTSPDSFVVTLGPDATRAFADTARAGGTVHCFAFEDRNSNLSWDVGQDLPMPGAKFQVSPTNQVAYADTGGNASMFAPVGSYSVACTGPDSFVVVSTNPVTGTMTNGGNTNVSFALRNGGFGYVNGIVYLDTNRNATYDGPEPGIANVWVGVTPDGGVTVPGYAYTNASGGFSIKVPVNDPPHTTAYSVMVIPPTGFYPTSTTSIPGMWVQNGQTYSNNNFGMSSFQIITLNASRVLSLASGDVVEKDWPGTSTSLAHADADLVLGADAAGTDQVSTWFNQYNSTPLFTAAPTYTRSAPNAVLSMALDTLDGSVPKNRPDLVTGTKVVAAGNFFVWFNQNTSGNEGYFPTTYSASQNYKTLDLGDVQSVLTYDCSGAASKNPDIIVGTKSPTAGQGTIEVWKSSNAVTPTFTRDDVYPTAGGLGAGTLGEVTSMVLADFDGDGKRDLAVGTTRLGFSGQVVFFKFVSKSASPHFAYMSTVTLPTDAVTAITVVDVNGDGRKDVVVGTQNSTSSGNLIYLQNTVPALFTFTVTQTVGAPGIVTSMLTADLGGTAQSDIALGFRQSTSTYAGGLRIYYLDSPSLPSGGTDPSGGAVTNMVPALTSSNFNFGANPAPSAPFLADVAAGVKSSATTGALVVFIR